MAWLRVMLTLDFPRCLCLWPCLPHIYSKPSPPPHLGAFMSFLFISFFNSNIAYSRGKTRQLKYESRGKWTVHCYILLRAHIVYTKLTRLTNIQTHPLHVGNAWFCIWLQCPPSNSPAHLAYFSVTLLPLSSVLPPHPTSSSLLAV